MLPFSIKVRKPMFEAIKFSINYNRYNIAISGTNAIAGPIPEGEPDLEVNLVLLSEDASEIFHMAAFAALQKQSITL